MTKPSKLNIYGTIGPACATRETLSEMFLLGMTGLRLNLSHMTLQEAEPLLDEIHAAGKMAGVKPDVLIDLQGPELRIGKLDTPIALAVGQSVRLQKCCRKSESMTSEGNDSASLEADRNDSTSLEVDCKDFTNIEADCVELPIPATVLDVLKPGDELMLDDGKILIMVDGMMAGGEICGKVLRGGTLQSRKSIAVPNREVDSPALTDWDLENLRSAKSYGVTALMQPFVRGEEDLKKVRLAMKECNCEDLRLLAKIENRTGVEHLAEIAANADEIVIARGDLGNAYPLWELPGVQKQISKYCNAIEKPFMVVTQMLASMEHAAIPTRAEVSDIYNAVCDGAASVMVTGETAVGEYPVEVVRYLVNTVNAANTYGERST